MTAVETLNAARAAGVHLGVDGDALVLEAGSEPPAAVLDALSRHKAEIMTLLRPDHGGWSAEDWQVFFDERAGVAEFDGGMSRTEAETYALECCVVEWMNRHPCPSTPGRCAQCDGPGSTSAVVLPFGTEPGSHVWLHAECWAVWYAARRKQAVEGLALIGITKPERTVQRSRARPGTEPCGAA